MPLANVQVTISSNADAAREASASFERLKATFDRFRDGFALSEDLTGEADPLSIGVSEIAQRLADDIARGRSQQIDG